MKAKLRTVSHKKWVALLSLLAVLPLALAACQSAATSTQPPAAPLATSTTAPTAVPATEAPAEAELAVATDPVLGKILVDGKGLTLYMFTKDEPGKSNCDADCLAKWPPLLTQGSPKLGDGVQASLIGSAALADGTQIVTYNQMPLYYWVKDVKAGDTTGQGVGSVWYVVSPEGKVIGQTAANPTATPEAVAFEEPTVSMVVDPVLGKILVDGKGMTLYMFTKDEPGKSNCDTACLAKWPPLLTQGSPKRGEGVEDEFIGTAPLSDGTQIVTYNQMPLYYWVKDVKAGDTTGQGVGSVWYVVSPDGEIITGADDDSSKTPSPVASGSSGSAEEVTIQIVEHATLGSILVDGKGMTLYIFTKDTPGKSNCDAACLEKWPPLLTQGNPILGPGADDSKIGTALLADGTKIVTYNGWPLYYWVNDAKPGDATGQGVGGVWYVVDRDGDIVR